MLEQGIDTTTAEGRAMFGMLSVQQIADVLRVPRSTLYGHLDKASTGSRTTPANGNAPPA